MGAGRSMALLMSQTMLCEQPKAVSDGDQLYQGELGSFEPKPEPGQKTSRNRPDCHYESAEGLIFVLCEAW